MKNLLWLLLVVTNISLAQNGGFPKGPNSRFTPGKYCDRPVEYRYPEQISYCGRDVALELKVQVFHAYGFNMQAFNRADYKIDHYVPLCAGGSNDFANLWPQHVSISRITDSIEEKGCKRMVAGKISQKNFIALIVMVKNDNSKAQYVHQVLNRL